MSFLQKLFRVRQRGVRLLHAPEHPAFAIPAAAPLQLAVPTVAPPVMHAAVVAADQPALMRPRGKAPKGKRWNAAIGWEVDPDALELAGDPKAKRSLSKYVGVVPACKYVKQRTIKAGDTGQCTAGDGWENSKAAR